MSPLGCCDELARPASPCALQLSSASPWLATAWCTALLLGRTAGPHFHCSLRLHLSRCTLPTCRLGGSNPAGSSTRARTPHAIDQMAVTQALSAVRVPALTATACSTTGGAPAAAVARRLTPVAVWSRINRFSRFVCAVIHLHCIAFGLDTLQSVKARKRNRKSESDFGGVA